MKRNRQPDQSARSSVSKKNKPGSSETGIPVPGVTSSPRHLGATSSPRHSSMLAGGKTYAAGTRSPRTPLGDVNARVCDKASDVRVSEGMQHSPKATRIPQSSLGKPLSAKKLKCTQSPKASLIPSSVNSPRGTKMTASKIPQSPSMGGAKVHSKLPQSPQSSLVSKVKASSDVESRSSNSNVESMTTGEFLKMDIVMSSKTGRVKMRAHEHENVGSLHFPSPEGDLNKSVDEIEPKVKSLAENYEVKLRDSVIDADKLHSVIPRGRGAIARGKHVAKERMITPKRNVDLTLLNEISPTVELVDNSDFSDVASTSDSPKVACKEENIKEVEILVKDSGLYEEDKNPESNGGESNMVYLQAAETDALNRSIDNLDVDIKSLSKMFDERTDSSQRSSTTSTPDRALGRKDRGAAAQFKQVENIATPSQILKFNKGGVTLRQKTKGRKAKMGFNIDRELDSGVEHYERPHSSPADGYDPPPDPQRVSVDIESLRNIFESGGAVAKKVKSRNDPKSKRLGLYVDESPKLLESGDAVSTAKPATPRIVIYKPGGSQASVQDDDIMKGHDKSSTTENISHDEDQVETEHEQVQIYRQSPQNELSREHRSHNIQDDIDEDEGEETNVNSDEQSTFASQKKTSVASRLAERLSRISENLKMLEDVVYIESPKSGTLRKVDREQISEPETYRCNLNHDNVFESPNVSRTQGEAASTSSHEAAKDNKLSADLAVCSDKDAADKEEGIERLTIKQKPGSLESKCHTKSLNKVLSADSASTSFDRAAKDKKHKFSSVDVDPNEESEESPGKKRCTLKYESTPIVGDRDVRFSVTLDDKTPATSWNSGGEGGNKTSWNSSIRSSSAVSNDLDGNLSETAFNKLLQTTCEGSRDRTGWDEKGHERMEVTHGSNHEQTASREMQHSTHIEHNNNQTLGSKEPCYHPVKGGYSQSDNTWLDNLYKAELLICGDCDDNITDLYEEAVELLRQGDTSGRADLSFDEMVVCNQQVLHRYHTQPVEDVEGGGVSVGPARHLTQPITPTEKEAARDLAQQSSGGEMSSSIANRLSSLQQRGENDWRRRVDNSGSPSGSSDSESSLKERQSRLLDKVQGDPVKLRSKPHLRSERPVSLADRMSCLEDSQKTWKHRVGEKDATKFTVEGRMAELGDRVSDSPLVNKTRSNLQREPENVPSPLRHKRNGLSPQHGTPHRGTQHGTPHRATLPPDILLQETSPRNGEALSTPNIPVSAMIVSESEQIQSDDDQQDKENTVVSVPEVDTEEFQSFYVQPSMTQLNRDRQNLNLADFDSISGHTILPSTKKARPQQRRAQGSRNPLKALAQRQDLVTEYQSHSTGVADRELRRIKKQQIAGKACMATDALAALATKEDFDRVKLRKADTDAVTPVTGGERFIPYKDIMLLHVKGRRSCHSRLVQPVATSVNSGDCFILKTPQKVYVWIGEFCNVIEKSKAIDVAQTVQQKHDLGCKTSQPPVIVYENKPIMSSAQEFWDTLGGFHTCQAPGPVEEDELYEMYLSDTNIVYRVTGDKLVPVKEYWGQTLKYSMLSDKEAFVFDFGSEVYLWTGKQVAFSDRKVAMKLTQEVWGQGYDYTNCDINPLCPLRAPDAGGLPSSSPKRPDWALLAKVSQNMETILFKEKFIDWPDSSSTVMALKEDKDKQYEVVELKPCDVTEMVPLDTTPVDLVLEGSHIGRGDKWVETHDGIRREFEVCTLDVAVWHVLEYEHCQIDPPSYGHFHEGDTYVIRWRYMVTQSGIKSLKGSNARHSLTGREKCAYFFWQGRHSSITEKGASALMTVELDEERGPQIRVVQGKEPPCFIQLFEGHMTCHIGRREEAESNTAGDWRLYVVRNELSKEAYLREVPPCVQNLRSRGSFVLLNVKSGVIYVWHGAKSSSHTKERAAECARNLKERCALEVGLSPGAKLSITEVTEGTEPAPFWRGLQGNKADFYSLGKDTRLTTSTARLFHLSSVSGTFVAKEILNPARSNDLVCPFPVLQTDLYNATQPALFLLSAGRCVFVWQGWWPEETEGSENVKTGSAENRLTNDRILAMETAVAFCKELFPSVTPRCELVYAGLEPDTFINLFPTWEVRSEVTNIQVKEGRSMGQTVSVPEYLHKLTQTKYSYAELQQRPLPEGVNTTNMEKYLREDEWENVLQMTVEEFYALPLWKRSNIKKEKGLF